MESNFTEFWKHGVRDYQKGKNQKSNPHPRLSLEWEEWLSGWRFARNTDYVIESKRRVDKLTQYDT